jgi:aspartyl/glutamyl-tRNA(asn/gln) amidotransferase, C subunit
MNDNLGRTRALAKVSQIALSGEELNIIEKRLRDVEIIFRDLDIVETSEFAPMDRACDSVNVLREKELSSPADCAGIMKNAPERDRGCFVVPRVVE